MEKITHAKNAILRKLCTFFNEFTFQMNMKPYREVKYALS